VFEYQALDFAQVLGAHTSVARQRHRIKPKLAFPVRAANVDVRRFPTFVGIEVESECPNSPEPSA
jgi:hypothetical protein